MDFDATTSEACFWSFIMPNNYASGGTLNVLWHANATSGDVDWAGSVSAVSASDVDTPLEHAFSTAAITTTNVNATEARRLNTTAVTLNMDSAAAGDMVTIRLVRDVADTMSVDAEVTAVGFDYVTA